MKLHYVLTLLLFQTHTTFFSGTQKQDDSCVIHDDIIIILGELSL